MPRLSKFDSRGPSQPYIFHEIGHYHAALQPDFCDAIEKQVLDYRGDPKHRFITYREYRDLLQKGLSTFVRQESPSFEEFLLQSGVKPPSEPAPLLPLNSADFFEDKESKEFQSEAYYQDLENYHNWTLDSYEKEAWKTRERNRVRLKDNRHALQMPRRPTAPSTRNPNYWQTTTEKERDSLAFYNATHERQIEAQRQQQEYLEAREQFRERLLRLKADYNERKRNQPLVPSRELEAHPSYEFVNLHLNFLDEFVFRFVPDPTGFRQFAERLAPRIPWLKDWFQKPHTFQIAESDRQRHTYITGSSGSGKSELIKVLVHRHLETLRGNKSLVVLDPHGDVVREIAQHENLSDSVSPEADPRRRSVPQNTTGSVPIQAVAMVAMYSISISPCPRIACLGSIPSTSKIETSVPWSITRNTWPGHWKN